MSGKIDVLLNGRKRQQRFCLKRSYNGLHVCPMIWRGLDDSPPRSVCIVLASSKYTGADCDFSEFPEARRHG
jgi:WxcM-like, C-terminal